MKSIFKKNHTHQTGFIPASKAGVFGVTSIRTDSKSLTFEAGFTLLEMLFAVIIFSFALVSLMTIAGKGIIATTTARQQLTAQFLAEESLEVARNMRDTNYIEGLPWLTGMDQCQDSPCDVDYSSTAKPGLIACDGDDCAERILTNNRGTFAVDQTGDVTSFYRELTLTSLDQGSEQMLVTATVHWTQRTINRTLVLKTRIANW